MLTHVGTNTIETDRLILRRFEKINLHKVQICVKTKILLQKGL